MARLPPETRLLDLSIPGTHDSGSYPFTSDSVQCRYGDQPEFVRAIEKLPRGAVRPLKERLVAWCRTQDRDFEGQLQMGIRCLDLRVEWRVDGTAPPANERFYFVHGLYGDEVGSQLGVIRRFLDAHPREIVFLEIGGFMNFGDTEHAGLIELLEDSFDGLFVPRTDKTDALTVGGLWERNERVVVVYDVPPPVESESTRTRFWPRSSRDAEWSWATHGQGADVLKQALDDQLDARDPNRMLGLGCTLTPNGERIRQGELNAAGIDALLPAARAGLEAARLAVLVAEGAVAAAKRTGEWLERMGLRRESGGRAVEEALSRLEAAQVRLEERKQEVATLERRVGSAPRSLAEMARPLNDRARGWLTSDWSDKPVNIIAFDFPDDELVRVVIDRNSR